MGAKTTVTPHTHCWPDYASPREDAAGPSDRDPVPGLCCRRRSCGDTAEEAGNIRPVLGCRPASVSRTGVAHDELLASALGSRRSRERASCCEAVGATDVPARVGETAARSCGPACRGTAEDSREPDDWLVVMKQGVFDGPHCGWAAPGAADSGADAVGAEEGRCAAWVVVGRAVPAAWRARPKADGR